MKRREVIKGPPTTDLLVCFPTRSHLALMPRTACSPSRPSNTHNHRHKRHHQRGKSTSSGVGDGGLWSKKSHMVSELSEPTSPKVTCVGQVKARPKSRSCKNWHSVMEEIERLHNDNNKKYRKKPSFGDVKGFKKESIQFLTCLRSFKFDLGCFGAFPNANLTSDDDDDNHNDDHVDGEILNHDDDEDEEFDDHEDGSSRGAFSKWLMVLEENKDFVLHGEQEFEKYNNGDNYEAQAPRVPPSNALLLMRRCRSAPVKRLIEKEGDSVDEHNNNDDDDQHEDEKETENMMDLMNYEGDFHKLSCDIAKETWVVGGINKDPFSRTQSSKRCPTECLQQVKDCLQ